ncbi:hypothetical protein IC611_02830 [Proteus mirabilis]
MKRICNKRRSKKKFDNSNIVHEKGVSKEKVISQKGVTELFQPKGNYQPAGNYVTTATFNLEINKKIDKASLSQQLGNDVNKVPSLDLVTKELGNKQPKGDYALKTWVDNIYYKRDDSPSFNEISATAIRVNSVNVALKGDCYTKSESDNKYSPKLPFVYSSGEESKIISPNNKILIFVNDNGTTGGYDRDTQATVWGLINVDL